MKLKVSVRLESTGLPFRKAIEQVQRMDVPGVHVDAVGDLAPDALTQTGRREFRNLLKSRALELAALHCLLRHGLDAPDRQEERIEHVRKVMDLSYDLGARLVTVQPGKVPKNPENTILTQALWALGTHGDRTGTVLALETGLDSGDDLAKYLAGFDTGGLGVTLDPGNLLMNGFDPYESARLLHDRVRFVQARDARTAAASRSAQEAPLGGGDVEWMRFLGVLEEINYRGGWISVVREGGTNRLGDVTAGVDFLRRFVG